MDFFLPLGVAIRAWQSAASLLLRSAIWLPFLLIAAFQALGIFLLLGFYHDALLPIGEPLVEMLGGAQAVHYPFLYLALPMMFSKLNIGITLIVSSLAGGVATLLFARAFGMRNTNEAWKRALRRWPTLIVLTAVMLALTIAESVLTSLVPHEVILQSQGIRWGVRALALLIFVLIQGFLAYTTPWVVLRGQSAWPALRDSVRVAIRTFLPTFIVIAVPAFLLYPFSYVSNSVELVASRFRPELIGALVGIQLFFELIALFIVVGAVTRLFLWRMEATR